MKRCFVLLFFLTSCCSSSFGSGLYLWPQDAVHVSNYGAGAAAAANDASTSFYNPAGLTRIKRQAASFVALSKTTSVQYRGQTTVSPTISDFSPTSGIAQGGEFRWIPTLLYAAPTGDKWGFGFSLTSPADVDINYGESEFTRYTITRNDLRLIDLTPSIGYRILPNLSIGVGFDAQYAELQFYQINNNTTAIANDKLTRNDLRGWGAGWNAGILWEILPTTRLGLHYRSQVVHQLTGTSETGNNSSRGRAHLVIPPVTTLSLYHEATPKLTLLGTLGFTQWSSFNDFTIKNCSSSTVPYTRIIQSHLRNTWLASVGAQYSFTPKFSLHGGLGYDEGAAASDLSSLAMPDSDHYLAGIGASYLFSKDWSFDMGYLHSFSPRASINETQISNTQQVTNIGNVNLADDMIALQLNWFMT